ncbi:hypothetical protein KI688_004440 [Linnemannia hyalina]|uniref:Uncharacterized protein n=1 Tax=Linnemannia hyalina TaxID=64524 RepID=A0A9P7XLJ0_9FUNG|nr:hypothetical protein KI688_004440 [Linnemannia hyalina]
MPVYRAEVTCTVALKSGGTATEKFITILELNTPLRDLAKLFTESGLCLLEEVLDFTEGYMEMVGTVRECLRPDVELFVRGRQLSQKEIEQAAFSWFFSSHAISTPLITQELTQAMSTTLARALVPALIPSLIPALVPALAPALAPELIQNIAALQGSSTPPSQPRSHRLIASSSHNKIITPQDMESGFKTATVNKDPHHISEESSSSSESNDEDMDQDSSSESEDEGPEAAVEEMKIQEESSSGESSSDEGDKDNDDHEHTKDAPAQMIKKATPALIVKKDAAQIKQDNDNALVDLFKDDVYMESDSDSSSDEDKAKPLMVVPQVAFQAAVAKVEPQVKESKDTTTISKPLVPVQSTPFLASPESLNPVHLMTTTSSPAKVVESKPIVSSGLDSLLTAQSSTSSSSVSSSSASSSPASSPSSSPTPVRSPAPSPAPAPRRESASIFATPAVIASASTPLPEKAPLSDAISSFSPYRAFTAIATAPATSPIMSRTTSSSSLSSSSSSSTFLKRPSPDQSRHIVSPERPKKKQAGFAISVPLDPFRALSPEDRSDEDSEDDVRYSQEVLYSALSRPRRTPSPVKDDEEEMPVYIPLNLVVKQQQEDEDEDEGESQSDHEQIRSEVILVKVDDHQEDEPLKSEAPWQEPMSITSSSEQSSPSSQLTLVDIKQEHLSQNPSTVQAQYREAEAEANNATAAASVLLKLSTTRVFSDREDEEEDQQLSPVVSPPGALLEYLKSANSPASPKEQQPDLSAAPKHPLSESDSSAPAPIQAPVPTTPSKKSLAETMAAYPTFASLASLRGPDIPDTTSNTDEIVAFLDKDMEGLSRDSSLTGPPFFLPVRPQGLPANHINKVTPTRVADMPPPPPFDDESTVSPELRPSVSPMFVPNIENRNKEDIKMDDLDLDRIPETQLHSDNEDSIFNIPSSQRPALPGTGIAAAAAAKAPNGWVDDTRDAMDDFQFSDDEERRATLKRRALEVDLEELSESEYEQQPTDIPEGMFGQNRVRQPGQPEYRYETVFKDIHLTPTPSVDSVQPKRPRLSSPSSGSGSGSDSDSDGSDAESSIVSSDEDEDEDDDKGAAANAKKPHPLDALGELPPMISSQSSFSIMPTLTALSQERTTMTKKMGSLEMALKQQRDDDNDEDDDDFAITIKHTGPPPVVRSRGRGGAVRGAGLTRGASSPGRGGRGGRGGVTIAAARTGGRHPDSDSDSDIDSGRGRSSLQNLFS